MKEVALQRMHVGSSVLRVRRVGHDFYIRFLFARLHPQVVVAFLPLRLVALGPGEMAPGSLLSGAPWKQLFEFDLGAFAYSDKVEWPAEGGQCM